MWKLSHRSKYILSAEGAVVESTTTTVTRKQQEYVISGNQIVEETLAAGHIRYITPLPSHVEAEPDQNVT